MHIKFSETINFWEKNSKHLTLLKILETLMPMKLETINNCEKQKHLMQMKNLETSNADEKF